MIDVTGGFGEHDGIGRIIAVLHADAREQIRHLVVLLLSPFLKRVIVTARAGQSLAEKRLRDVLGELDGVLVKDEVVQRAVLPGAACADEDVARELIPRLILFDAVAYPVVEVARGGRTELLARIREASPTILYAQ